MRALIIGDSMVDGSPLAKRLGELLAADGYAVTQAGLGATSADSWDDGDDVIKRAHKSVDTAKLPRGVDLLVVSLGTNDGANAYRAGGDLAAKAAKTASRMATIAQLYGARRTVWVLPPWMRDNVAWYKQAAMEYVYQAAPASGLELFDSRPVTREGVLAGSGDGVHPGGKVQRQWAEAIHAQISGGDSSALAVVLVLAALLWWARA